MLTATRCVCVLLALLAITSQVPARGEERIEDDAFIGRYRARLCKVRKINISDQPVDAALAQLSNETGVPITVRWHLFDQKRDAPTTPSTSDQPAQDAIRSIIEGWGGQVDFHLTEGGLAIVPKGHPSPLVTRAYDQSRDTHGLIEQVPNVADKDEPPTRSELMGQLQTLIADTIGTKKDWQQPGGKYRCEVSGSKLIIRTTLAHHAEIHRLRTQLRTGRDMAIHYEARLIEAPSTFFDDLALDHKLTFKWDAAGLAMLDDKEVHALVTVARAMKDVKSRSAVESVLDQKPVSLLLPWKADAPPFVVSLEKPERVDPRSWLWLPDVDDAKNTMKVAHFEGLSLVVNGRIAGDRRSIPIKLEARYARPADENNAATQWHAQFIAAHSLLPDKACLLMRQPLTKRRLTGMKQVLDSRTGQTTMELVSEPVKHDGARRVLCVLLKATIVMDEWREGGDPPSMIDDE